MGFLLILGAYILGGVTFIPVLVTIFIYLHPKSSQPSISESFKAGEIEENSQSGLDSFKKGWLVVTHEFIESTDDISSRTETVAESPEVKTAYSSLYKLVKNTKAESSDSVNTTMQIGHTQNFSPEGTSLNLKKLANKRHRYYAVLKHGNLFLYKNERMKDVKHVIVLQNHIVALWPPSLSEGSLFTKYSSIAILKNNWTRARRLSDDLSDTEWTEAKKLTVTDLLNPKSNLPAPPGTFFIYTDITIEKEDWYFALIRATKAVTLYSRNLDPKVFAKTLHFDTANMMNLIQSLYSSEGQLQTKWLNALIGRLFLSLQGTDVMRNYLVSRIEKKLSKLKTPGFLEKFQITKVNAGNSAPLITYPALKEINPSGELLLSFNLHYFGDLSLQISTKANINLGTRFKTKDVDLALSITLEKIEGPMLLKIKPPPTARIWYTYEHEPNMTIKIEPIISSRQMSYTIITSSIEKIIKEAVRDSLVLPHWDDMIFYFTEGELYRGGVWDKDARKSESSNGTKPAEDDSVKLDSSSLLDMPLSKPTMLSIATTLNEFTKRLRKPKSEHTLVVDETNCLSDGTVIVRGVTASSAEASEIELREPSATSKKVSNWYAKFDKSDEAKSAVTSSSSYHPPEMISNRRGRKQSSASTISSDSDRDPYRGLFDFDSQHKDSVLLSRSLDLATHDLRLEPEDLTTTPITPKLLKSELHDRSIAQSLSEGAEVSAVPNYIPKRSATQLHRKPPPTDILEESLLEDP
ncbi:hypothetical protein METBISCDRAFT_19535 [Metschnikowia bicuspidata]|uniref:SMP-LTD domain-containing protein n=1 Tax=Metschnikowia bicuspidata TaxID=27322 RepID=A0A4P9ZB90_9ASCO|nr:hypothetical protein METBISCDRAFT_19535 [Metschnikowia bicuspidata]